jgi:hypothetical protein
MIIMEYAGKPINRLTEGTEMKSIAAIISVLMVTSALTAGDPVRSALDFSLVSHNGVTILGAGSSVGTGLSLAQPARKTSATAGQEVGKLVGSRLERGSMSLPAPGEYRSQARPTTTVSKASGSTLLIIGAVLAAGGGILIAATDSLSGTGIGIILVAVGGITIYKGIEVLISSGRSGLQTAIRVSF